MGKGENGCEKDVISNFGWGRKRAVRIVNSRDEYAKTLMQPRCGAGGGAASQLMNVGTGSLYLGNGKNRNVIRMVRYGRRITGLHEKKNIDRMIVSDVH